MELRTKVVREAPDPYVAEGKMGLMRGGRKVFVKWRIKPSEGLWVRCAGGSFLFQ